MQSFQLNSLINRPAVRTGCRSYFFLWNMDNGTFSILSVLFIVLMVLLLPRGTLGEPRTQLLQRTCPKQIPINNTVFVSNCVAALENVRTQIQTESYGVAAEGQAPVASYALVQCYGDLSLVDCMLCYSEARTTLPQCYPYNGGRVFLDGCFLRTANYSFFNEFIGPEDEAICGNRTRKNSVFQETARQAILQAASYAQNNKGYAQGKMPVLRDESVYVLANCWKTLNAKMCRICLENASTSMLGCLPWSEGRALNTGCFMRYSDTNFLNPMPSNSSSRGTPTVVIVVVVSSAIVVAGSAVIGAWLWKRRRIKKKRKGSYDVKKLAKLLRDSSLNFKYSMLEKATGSFDEANKLGQGGFGTVYKGVLPDGREIAAKRLFFNNLHREADFYNEINIISSLEHKNLVRLLGCSCSGSESLLIYEFLPNRSLDCFIFDPHEGKSLNWQKRFEIIIGIAEGLVYLHKNSKMRIIHRDIKASNILLDVRFRAKIGDFGLARSFREDNSHISTGIAGTFGYMAPEYLFRGELTEKTDVYSFGVLLLEIVTGRQNNKSTPISDYSVSGVTITWKHFKQGTAKELIDPNLMLHKNHNANVKNEVVRVIHVGLLCTQEIPLLRPSMPEALQMLTGKDENLPPPTNPPFVDEKTMGPNDTFEKSSYPLIFGNPDSVATISHSIFYPR